MLDRGRESGISSRTSRGREATAGPWAQRSNFKYCDRSERKCQASPLVTAGHSGHLHFQAACRLLDRFLPFLLRLLLTFGARAALTMSCVICLPSSRALSSSTGGSWPSASQKL